MRFFSNKFPYTNLNYVNLDWIIKRVKELGETVRSYAQDIANAVAQAEAAQEAAKSVTSTAESAVATAQEAEATANAIAGTANSALTTAQAAETTAQAAETTANAIAGTANTALSTAQAANTTAQAAEESADNAETIAGTASANASNAVQTANTALATANSALVIASQFDVSALDEKAGALVESKTGAIVTFFPDRTIQNIRGVSVQAESGADAVEVQRTGKNLIDTANAISGLCGYRAGDTLDTVVASTRYSHSVQIPAHDGLTLSFKSNDPSTFNLCIIECFVGRNWVRALTPDSVSDTSTVRVLTVPANTYDWIKVMYSAPAGGIVGTNINGDIQLETGSSSTDFTPYTGNSYTIQPGQLDPVQIATIAGQLNNVWSNAGNVTVEYAADLKWYIDTKIAELQALVLENGG